jgi:RNA-directed DNA polymerase
MQMTAASAAGAPANVPAEWNAITSWPTLRRQVRRLQVRIAKAVKDNRYGKAYTP